MTPRSLWGTLVTDRIPGSAANLKGALMNAILSTASPLPACLETRVACPSHRRHRVGPVDLNPAAVDRFNRLLENVGWTQGPLDRDRLATAARELASQQFAALPPACIRQRLRRVKAAVCMVEDRQWRAPDEAASTVRLIADYVAANDDLFPDTVPLIGRFDDAILIEAAWPRLARDVTEYMDFRRLRRYATDRGPSRVSFDRNAWSQARLDEARLFAEYQRIRTSSFLPERASIFRIH